MIYVTHLANLRYSLSIYSKLSIKIMDLRNHMTAKLHVITQIRYAKINNELENLLKKI